MYSFIQKSAADRFGSLNTLLTLPVEKDCVGEAKPCACGGETGDIILLNEIKVYPKCSLSYKRVCNHCNTGSCARVCVCVCVCVPRTPHGGLSDTSALEISSGGGSGLNSGLSEALVYIIIIIKKFCQQF